MKLSLKRAIESQRTGLYIGPDAVIGVTAKEVFSRHEVLGSAAFFDEATPVVQGLNDFHLEAVRKVLLSERHGRHPADGNVQVVFDDRLVRFFLLPVADKPDRDGVTRLLRWHADKVLSAGDEYEYSARLDKSAEGYKVFGAAINKAMLGRLAELFDALECPWYVADSVSGFVWSHLDQEFKHNPAALIRFSHHGWSLMAWEANGDVALVKTVGWRRSEMGEPMVRDALAEAARLLAVYSDKRPQAGFASLYFDRGDFVVEQAWFGEMFPGLAVQPAKPAALPGSVSMVSEGYAAEYRAAYLASLARR